MILQRLIVVGLLGAAGMFSQPVAPGKTHLKVGDSAPEFTLTNSSTGKPVSLSDYRGKKTVVLAFFPAAFTGG